MSESSKKLLQLIEVEKSCNEICDELSISNKQLFNHITVLENKGFEIKREYWNDGKIIYKPYNFMTVRDYMKEKYQDPNTVELHLINKHAPLKCMLISDLHFGNKGEELALLDQVYNYCTSNDIHVILCCGDLIDGLYSNGNHSLISIYEQMDYFVKNYPFDKNIITIAVAGDHDQNGLYLTSQSIQKITANYRHDIIVGGFGITNLNISKDNILLYHPMTALKKVENAFIILKGHSHFYSTVIDEQSLQICVPSLSTVIEDKLPTALEAEFSFKTDKISEIYMRQIFFQEKPYILNSFSYDLQKIRKKILE